MASNLNRATHMINNVISNMMLRIIRRLGSNLSLLSETKCEHKATKERENKPYHSQQSHLHLAQIFPARWKSVEMVPVHVGTNKHLQDT